MVDLNPLDFYFVLFGFQHAKGTHNAIFSFQETVYELGVTVATVFCDLTKTFDCVDHRILNWFDFYLEGHSQ